MTVLLCILAAYLLVALYFYITLMGSCKVQGFSWKLFFRNLAKPNDRVSVALMCLAWLLIAIYLGAIMWSTRRV